MQGTIQVPSGTSEDSTCPLKEPNIPSEHRLPRGTTRTSVLATGPPVICFPRWIDLRGIKAPGSAHICFPEQLRKGDRRHANRCSPTHLPFDKHRECGRALEKLSLEYNLARRSQVCGCTEPLVSTTEPGNIFRQSLGHESFQGRVRAC